MKQQLAMAAFGLLIVAPVSADETKKDLEKMQGTWVVVKMAQAGQEVPEDQLKDADFRLVIKGDKFTYHFLGQTLDGSIKIDGTKKPKTLNAEGGGQETHGIYKIEGDKMTVCFVPAGSERPTEFKSEDGSEANLIVYKKQEEKE